MKKKQLIAKDGAVILNHCQGCTVTIYQHHQMQDIEMELLRIYRSLSVKQKIDLLGYAMALEDQTQQEKA